MTDRKILIFLHHVWLRMWKLQISLPRSVDVFRNQILSNPFSPGDIKELVIGEKCSLLSLTYLIIILMAYHGPNAEILGNIKLVIWQFQNPITDIEEYSLNVIILLVVDFISLIVNGVLIRVFCKINVLKVMKDLQKEFWHVFWAAESFLLMEVEEYDYYLFYFKLIYWLWLINFNSFFHVCRFSCNWWLVPGMIWTWSSIGWMADTFSMVHFLVWIKQYLLNKNAV